MNILIISNHSYPHQGPRAFRTAELAEELSHMGHNVIVYVVSAGDDYTDYTKETGVIVKPIKVRLAVNRGDAEKRYNFFDKIVWHLLHKLIEWPDIEYKYRVPEILEKEKNVDCLITIAFPHAIHWGAARSKMKYPECFPQCWIGDCGDPYMFNTFVKPFAYFKKEEKCWCRLVDYITVPTEQSKKGYYPEFAKKIRVIPQGFNFSKTPIAEYHRNEVPTFAYTGSFYPGLRDPYNFFDFLTTLRENFRCIFYIHDDIPAKYYTALGDKLIIRRNWKRKDIIYALSQMDFLLNISNKNSTNQVPSKLIDYAIANRPVLNIDTDFHQQKEVFQFFRGDYSAQMHLPDLSHYDIRNVARMFVLLIEEKVNNIKYNCDENKG